MAVFTEHHNVTPVNVLSESLVSALGIGARIVGGLVNFYGMAARTCLDDGHPIDPKARSQYEAGMAAIAERLYIGNPESCALLYPEYVRTRDALSPVDSQQ